MPQLTQLDYVVFAFEVFVDGFGKGGSGEKLKLPKVTKVTEKFRGGGMLGTRKVALGYDVLELSVDYSAFDPQVMEKSALLVRRGISFSVRGYLTGDNNAQHTVIAQMRGETEELDPGTWEGGKKAMLSTKTSLDAYKLTIDGSEVFNLDFQNNVFSASGTDVFAAVNAAIGYL